MNVARLTPKYRFAIALGASLGIGHVLLRAFTSNLGPIVGLIAGVSSTVVIAVAISWAMEISVKRAEQRTKS